MAIAHCLPVIVIVSVVQQVTLPPVTTQNAGTHAASLGVVLSVGLLIGGVGTSAAHECMHRPRGHRLRIVGDWLMALSMDGVFPIEHNHGHHKNVGTVHDAATARYGESVYRFIGRSTWGEHANAWRVERDRLERQSCGLWSLHNRYLRALARSAAFPILAALAGGGFCALVVLLSMLWAKVLLETVNYIEHYGLVRVPNAPIEPRHSWNSTAWMSSTITFLLTRHSHHHQHGALPFWRLNDMPDAPTLPWGYLSAIYIALLRPAHYRAAMQPHLDHWFDHYASREESPARRALTEVIASADDRLGETDTHMKLKINGATAFDRHVSTVFCLGHVVCNAGHLPFHKGFDGTDIGDAYSAAAWAALVSPFFVRTHSRSLFRRAARVGSITSYCSSVSLLGFHAHRSHGILFDCC